ncbi:hypothetical protein D3C87_1908880 [compost metagenome]
MTVCAQSRWERLTFPRRHPRPCGEDLTAPATSVSFEDMCFDIRDRLEEDERARTRLPHSKCAMPPQCKHKRPKHHAPAFCFQSLWPSDVSSPCPLRICYSISKETPCASGKAFE